MRAYIINAPSAGHTTCGLYAVYVVYYCIRGTVPYVWYIPVYVVCVVYSCIRGIVPYTLYHIRDIRTIFCWDLHCRCVIGCVHANITIHVIYAPDHTLIWSAQSMRSDIICIHVYITVIFAYTSIWSAQHTCLLSLFSRILRSRLCIHVFVFLYVCTCESMYVWMACVFTRVYSCAVYTSWCPVYPLYVHNWCRYTTLIHSCAVYTSWCSAYTSNVHTWFIRIVCWHLIFYIPFTCIYLNPICTMGWLRLVGSFKL